MKEVLVKNVRLDSVVADFDTVEEAQKWIEKKNIPQNFIIKIR